MSKSEKAVSCLLGVVGIGVGYALALIILWGNITASLVMGLACMILIVLQVIFSSAIFISGEVKANKKAIKFLDKVIYSDKK